MEPFLMHAEPVLAVNDVQSTIDYWRRVLGFKQHWTWGEPPVHGGVSWQGVCIQFTRNTDRSLVSKGNTIWIRVRNVQQLFVFHQSNNAEIAESLQVKPWGFAEYCLRDNNGYHLIFSGIPATAYKQREESATAVSIIPRKPTPGEYLSLVESVGWGKYHDFQRAEEMLDALLYAVVAEDHSTGKVVGCALLPGDKASFFYVKDVMVDPGYQRKHIGSAMMEMITAWLDEHAPENAFVTLVTPENLAPFYQQFDFSPVFAMHRSIKSKSKDTAE